MTHETLPQPPTNDASVMTTNSSGWLEISTAGFASFNQSRPPGHLVKELVQNSMDAIDAREGSVDLHYGLRGSDFVVECRDDGEGMTDLDAIRVVYLTFKKDSHLKRGRFGRGFKEILSIAKTATVRSGAHELGFLTEDGKQITSKIQINPAISGTVVVMSLPWGTETVADFDHYFSSFLVPANVELKLNGRAIAHRQPRHTIEANLTTEVYHPESHSWRKPRRKTKIELVPIEGDEQATLYEMGIPVAPAEWSVAYHANILQRVPMNPNRDALASGYAKAVHAACLPILIDHLAKEEVLADWVGSAGVACDETVQRIIVEKAFGKTAVRSVPAMGKRDFNDDAERVGATVVKTSQMSSGFREMAKAYLPTAKDRVAETQEKLADKWARMRFDPAEAEGERREWIKQRGGSQRVQQVLDFSVWFCQQLIDHRGDPQPKVIGAVAIGSRAELMMIEITTFAAHWSDDNRLTLALDTDCFWNDPLGAEALSILVHEAAHARNMHHGKSFNDEVERLAGVASEIMFEHGAQIRACWPGLVKPQRSSLTIKANHKPRGWLHRLWG